MHPEGKPAPMAKEEGTIVIDQKGSNWSKFLQFLGPGILIAVVYVDPARLPWTWKAARCSSTSFYGLSWCPT